MAKFNYGRAQNTADRLITRYGAIGKLLVLSKVNGKSIYTPQNATMVVLDYQNKQVDGTRIKSTDKQIFVSVKGITEISENDRIQDADGVTYEIVPPVKPLRPATTTVLYEIQGRS